jgi:hypothetical protein
MLKNLYKTWGQLAPDEVILDQWGVVWMQDRYSASVRIEPIEDGSLLPYEKFILQGYIQQCIHDRGWYFFLEQLPDYCKADVRTKLEDQPHQCGKYKNACHEVLLTAYLTALAAQRPVTTGVWQHFKGDEMEVIGKVGIGSILSPAFSMYSSDSDDFSLESDPSVKLRLFMHPVEPLRYCNVFHEAYYSDLVFYSHNSQGWARRPDSFLGLVGPEYPEQEGLLRFYCDDLS